MTFAVSWLSKSGVGIALLLEPTEKFGLQKEVMTTNRHSLSFILKYLKEYRKYLFQIFLGLLFGCVLQLILPFLTQAIVDIGIKKNDIDFILLVLLGELVIILSKASIDFIRRGCDIGAGDA